MIDQFTNLEDGDIALPTSSLDLSARMRDLRARQGLKQSEVARRMGLDPSIPSLWEQGKRMVPANRVRALADALEVSVEELLEGVSGAQRRPGRRRSTTSSRQVRRAARGSRAFRPAADRIRAAAASAAAARTMRRRSTLAPEDAPSEPWVVAERPPLDGWIPDGWQSQRIASRTSAPSLPDGYWLDPIKLEKTDGAPAAAQSAVRRRIARSWASAGSAGRGAGRADLQPLQPGRRVYARRSPAAGGNDLPLCVDGGSRRPDRWRAGRDAARALGRRPCFGHLAATPARLGAAVSHSTRRRRPFRRRAAEGQVTRAALVDARRPRAGARGGGTSSKPWRARSRRIRRGGRKRRCASASSRPGSEGVLLAMPCAVAKTAALGAKIVSVFRGNPARGLPTVTSVYVLSDYETGAPLSIMDGSYLTAIRTAAGSAVATRLLARAEI